MEKSLERNEREKDSSHLREDILGHHKKDIEVILIYPEDRGNVPPYAHYIIGYQLMNMGIKYQVCQDKTKELLDSVKNEDGIFKIFARSACFEHIPTILKRNNQLPSATKENSFTVVGGQASIETNARNHMLLGGIDAVNPGHAQPFFDFLEKLQQSNNIDREIAFQHSANVLATKDIQNVPKGTFPKFDKFPLLACRTKKDDTKENSVDHIIIPHYANCPNRCDFCSLIEIETNKVADTIANTIRDTKRHIPEIIFRGPTFEGELIKSFRKIVDATKDIQGYTPQTHMIMDSKQFQKKYYKETLGLLREFCVVSTRLGLNVIDGESAALVGRRNHGKLRTDKEIQEEKQGLIDIVKEGEMEHLSIDMLLTPFDTPQTIEKILDFYKELLMVSKKSFTKVIMYFLPLAPYPGTKLCERYKDHIDMKDYGQLAGSKDLDLSIRKFDEEPFGITCQKHYLKGLNWILKMDEEYINRHRCDLAYLNFFSLSIAYQCSQGKIKFEEIDIGFREYKNKPIVREMFDAIKKTAEAE